VLLKGDKDVPYGTVVEVMAALRTAGVVDLGMVTEPLREVK
jgi:biopolymer transport protein TolR